MNIIKKLYQLITEDDSAFNTKSNFTLPNKKNSQKNSNSENTTNNSHKIYSNIDVNLEYIKSKFNELLNSDVKIREFVLNVRSREFKAFLLFIDGMVDKNSINDFILRQKKKKNMSNQYDKNSVISEAIANNILVRKVKKFNIQDYIFNSLLPQNDVTQISNFDKVIEDTIKGNCILFIDTINVAFDIDVKKFDKRSIAEPSNEKSILGSKEAFVENLRTNTSILRRNLNNVNLIIENLSICKEDKVSCSVCYLKNVCNSSLVSEVKYRLNNLDINFLSSIGELQDLIKDDMNTTLPETQLTERVDKAISSILQGRIILIVNGYPYAMILPVTLFDFLSASEDVNMNNVFANMVKVIRGISFFITLLLPGLYIAVTTYHSELIPTELLFSIVASRSTIPFIVIVEIALMELSFEIIREAGIRVPSALGTTIRNSWCFNIRASCC